MPRTLRLDLQFDALGFGLEVPLEALEARFDAFSSRVDERRQAEAEGLGGATPQRYYIRCPGCEADASKLSSTEKDGRKVRMCHRCKSYFEVV